MGMELITLEANRKKKLLPVFKRKHPTVGLEMSVVMLYQNQFSYFSKVLFPYKKASVLLLMLCVTNSFQILLW